MFVKLFRALLLIVLVIVVSLTVWIRRNISKDIIKYNLIYALKENLGILVSFNEIEYLKPDDFIIKYLTINSPDIKVYAKTVKINIDLFEMITKRNFLITPQAVYIDSMKVEYKHLSKKEDEDFIDKILKTKIKTLHMKNSEILISSPLSHSYKIEIETLQGAKPFFSNSIEMSFKGRYIENRRTVNLSFDSEIVNKLIRIKKLTTQINSKEINIWGNLDLAKEQAELKFNLSSYLDIKELANIPHSIIIEPFTAEINGLVNKEMIILSSKVPKPQLNFLLKYDIKDKQVKEIDIKASKIEYDRIKDYLSNYVKDFKGKIDLDINITPSNHRYTIKAESKGFNFKDIHDAIDFKNTHAKFVMNPSFYALNIINTTGYFKDYILTGNIHIEGTANSEKIKTDIKLNKNYLKSVIYIQYADNPSKRRYKVDVKTENFSFQRLLDIIDYLQEKVSSDNSQQDTRYNFINKRTNLKLFSEGYEDEPYITAKNIIINADYAKTSSLLNSIGEFKIKITNGQIKNIQENIKKDKRYEILFLPLIQIYRLNRMGALKINYELKTINFSEIGCKFKANNGKIIIDKFYLNSVEFLIYGRGEIDFNSNKLNMEVYIINCKDYKQGTLPETLSDAKGRPALAFKISGGFETNEIKIMDATNITELVETEIKESIDIEG